MSAIPSIIDFCTDKNLLGLSLSDAQRCLLKATYGLPLTRPERDIFQLCTGRKDVPRKPFNEVTVIAGARSGKDSRIAAPIVCYEALFGGHELALHRGEQGVLVLVAQDARATKVAFGYIRDYLQHSPLLANSVDDVLASSITLTNGLTIETFPSTLRSTRGYSIPVAVLDELAFFRLEGSADSDAEIQQSVRRGMLSFPSPKLIKISTPYLKSGILYDDFKRGFGQDDSNDLLVWKSTSLQMNPSLKQDSLARQQRLDPQRYSREYEAEWEDSLSSFLPGDWVESAVMRGRHELPPLAGVTYEAAVDPSGGGPDNFTLALVHVEGKAGERKVVNDVLRGWGRTGTTAPDLTAVVLEITSLLRRYRVSHVTGDRYSAEWVRQSFRSAGIRYVESPLDRSQAYINAEPLFATSRISILDHPTLVRELKLLERRPQAGGKVRVDHPSSGSDDHANSLCLAAALAISSGREPELHVLSWTDDAIPAPEPPSHLSAEEQVEALAQAEQRAMEEARALEDRQRQYLLGNEGGWRRL